MEIHKINYSSLAGYSLPRGLCHGKIVNSDALARIVSDKSKISILVMNNSIMNLSMLVHKCDL